jgi:hypothetical protein
MTFVCFGNRIINVDLITNIVIWSDCIDVFVAANGSEGQSFVRLRGSESDMFVQWIDGFVSNSQEANDAE